MKKLSIGKVLLSCVAAFVISSCSSENNEALNDFVDEMQTEAEDNAETEDTTENTMNDEVIAVKDIKPMFEVAECGSIPESKASVSTDINAPGSFLVDTVVGARIGSESQTSNNLHYWSVELEAGVYHLMLDNRTISGEYTNMGVRVESLNELGVVIDELIDLNEIDFQFRTEKTLFIENPTTLRLKINAVFDGEDYQIGVFRNDSAVPSPFFSKCPDIKPLSLEVTESFELLNRGKTGANDVWYEADLGISDYTLLSTVVQSGGISTNVIYDVDVYDQLGQSDRIDTVIGTNDIELSLVSAGNIRPAEMGKFWIRFSNGHDPLMVEATLNKD